MEPGDTKFDASQYAFFGNNVLEEVELGGLDDDEAGDTAFVAAGDEEYTPIYGRDTLEDEGVNSFSGVDDLAGAFSKLNRTVNEPKQPGIASRGGSLSGQSSTADWAQEPDSSYWPTQPALDAEQRLDNKNWWSQAPHPAHFADSRLQRTSSSPQQDAQYNAIEPILGPRPSPLHRMSSYPHQEPQYNNAELIRGNGSRYTPALMQHPNGFIPPQMPPPHQQNGMLPIQHSPPQFSQLHAQMLGPQHSPPQNQQMFGPQHPHPQNQQMFGPRHPPPQMMGRFDPNFAMPDLSDPRARSMLHHGRQGPRYPPQGFELSNLTYKSCCPLKLSQPLLLPQARNLTVFHPCQVLATLTDSWGQQHVGPARLQQGKSYPLPRSRSRHKASLPPISCAPLAGSGPEVHGVRLLATGMPLGSVPRVRKPILLRSKYLDGNLDLTEVKISAPYPSSSSTLPPIPAPATPPTPPSIPSAPTQTLQPWRRSSRGLRRQPPARRRPPASRWPPAWLLLFLSSFSATTSGRRC